MCNRHSVLSIKKVLNMLKEYGFKGNEEYNSMRFQDYAIGEFFDLIKKEPFYKDTIFILNENCCSSHVNLSFPY